MIAVNNIGFCICYRNTYSFIICLTDCNYILACSQVHYVGKFFRSVGNNNENSFLKISIYIPDCKLCHSGFESFNITSSSNISGGFNNSAFSCNGPVKTIFRRGIFQRCTYGLSIAFYHSYGVFFCSDVYIVIICPFI